MKLKTVIISFFLLACASPEKEISNQILAEKVFVSILKEVHLAEANFELLKSSGELATQNTLLDSYQKIYNKYNLEEDQFQLTIDYYANHPDKLENIYAKVIEELTEERANPDQQ